METDKRLERLDQIFEFECSVAKKKFGSTRMRRVREVALHMLAHPRFRL